MENPNKIPLKKDPTKELFTACSNNDIETVRTLLAQGTPTKTDHGSALRCAIENHHNELALYLLDHGVPPEVETGASLRCAIRSNNIPITKTLLEKYNFEEFPQHILAGHCLLGETEKVRLLATPEAIEADTDDFLSLQVTAQQNHAEIAKILLLAGTSPDDPNAYFGQHPLVLAAQHGALETAEVLLDFGATVDIGNEFTDDNLPLLEAVQKKNLPFIKLLLEAGANPFGNYGTILDAALSNDNPQILTTLLCKTPLKDIENFLKENPDKRPALTAELQSRRSHFAKKAIAREPELEP